MFIGHFAVGFVAKKLSPQTSLGTYFMAAEWPDLLWPVFLLLGWEHVSIVPGSTKMMPLELDYMPYSHGLIEVVCWAILFGSFHFAYRRKAKDAMILGLCVLSHWLLDALVHKPDLPLLSGTGEKIGLGLWNFPLVTLVIEGGLFAIGLVYYLRSTRKRGKIGSFGLVGLIILLLAIYSGQYLNIMPPSANAVAISGNLVWVLVLFGYWVDRHRISLRT